MWIGFFWFWTGTDGGLRENGYDIFRFIKGGPNVVVKWLALLLRIRKVPGSTLGPKTGYSD
jgi:hypothetical protein